MINEGLLIAKILKGDDSAFAKLVNHYKDYVYSITISLLKNPAEADEAAQDTFIKVYKSLSGYKEESKFSSWLYSVAYRTGLDYIRKRKKTVELNTAMQSGELNIGETTAEKNIENQDLAKWLKLVMDQLPPSEASLLRLFYFDEMSIKEMVEITGLGESNIKVKLYRGRKLMREKLELYYGKELNLLNK